MTRPHPHDSVFGPQLDLFSELAAELYVDDRIDGSGRELSGGLRRLAISVIVDDQGSVSAYERRGEMLTFGRVERKVERTPPPSGGTEDA